MPGAASTNVHTTYLWHMHQPIYWPDESSWTPGRYETAYETITLGHSESDVFTIFDKDDRVGDYQWYPKDAVASMLDLPEAGAQVSFAGALKENLFSLGDAGWNGGRYAPDWYAHYRTARGWSNSAGNPRLEPLIVGFHHAIAPFDDAWGDTDFSEGFFPAETCFSERLIPALVGTGIDWAVVADLHIARCCENYPYSATQDNCDPPNRADQVNPSQTDYTNHSIPRGVTLKIPYPYGFTPHKAEYVDPETGEVSKITVVPAANAMSWDEGYGMFGTGPIDEIAGTNDPTRPMLILLAHDGDNAWSGGYSYYYESVSQFSHDAAAAGYAPTTIATYLADHPVPDDDIVHVEDGGWVNADGDFGSPQFINWNWPLVNPSGQFDIPGGWAEDERNWAVLTAAQNRVETAARIIGSVDPQRIVDPLSGANPAESAWHFLLAGYESGYMYYGASLDMEVKATLACNAAVAAADPVIAGGPDETPPTIWLPQRLPWNPGGYGGGSLWGYPGGQGAPMDTVFHVWTFVHDASGLSRVELKIREDLDGVNDPASHDNETYAGGPEVTDWIHLPLNHRAFPVDEPWEMEEIDFPVLPIHIADQFWIEVTSYSDVLLDYYVEAEDLLGYIKRSPIQHVYVGPGHDGGSSDAVWWDPEEPTAGDSLTIFYDPTGRPLDGALEVWIHLGLNGWQDVEDHVMSWDDQVEIWRYGFVVPSSASSIEFVFHDNAGTWDNNGGADWSIPVTGGEVPFVIDGVLDPDVPLLAEGEQGLRLWGMVRDEVLYLATEGTQWSPGFDRFLFVVGDTSAIRSAPWSKAGTVVRWTFLLGAEESNGWSGWFDAEELVVAGPAFASANGDVLEGSIDLRDVYATIPDLLHVESSGYETADGGVLAIQAPAGDGDGDLQAVEYYSLSTLPSAVEGSGPGLIRPELRLYPNPSTGQVAIELHRPRPGTVVIEVFDVAGRKVSCLFNGWMDAGPAVVSWDGSAGNGEVVAGGCYLLRVESGDETLTSKAYLLR
jgi:hypothetical protein